MTFLSPLALLWLGSVPVLLWLWRLASTQRQTPIPSLIPFEHLLRRPPRRRTRLFVNLLFWLQLAALIGSTLALAQPAIFQRRPQTTLVVLDTSASMGARLGGLSVMERAKRLLHGRLGRQPAGDHAFLVSSAPVAALTPQPTSEAALLRHAVETVRVSHTAGNLATAVQIGQALLGGAADRVLVVTDEPRPADLPDGVEFLTVGEPLPNVAIVGLETQKPLCQETVAHLVVTIENFSDETASVSLFAQQARPPGPPSARAGAGGDDQGRAGGGRRRIAEAAGATLAPHERRSVSLAMAEAFEGELEVILEAPRDALAVDNRAWVLARRSSTLPVTIVSEHPAFGQLIGEWLGACEGLQWSEGLPETSSAPQLVVTDREGFSDPRAVGVLQLLSSKTSRGAMTAHWLASGDHPIGSYLPSVEPVVASLDEALAAAAGDQPVLWGLVKGRRVPLVLAGEHEGRRMVSFFIDPLSSPTSVPLLVTFFNSLSWLMGQTETTRTAEPLVVATLPAGTLTIQHPDGTTQQLLHPGGTLRYEATAQAGLYRLRYVGGQMLRAVNFLDPLESNVLQRPSSWRTMPAGTPATPDESRTPLPLARRLILCVLAVLIAEWWLSCMRKR